MIHGMMTITEVSTSIPVEMRGLNCNDFSKYWLANIAVRVMNKNKKSGLKPGFYIMVILFLYYLELAA